MGSVNLLSFATFFCLMIIGQFYHWWKMKRENRIAGTFIDYMFYMHKGNSAATFISMLGMAWASAAAGMADNLNPVLIFEMLSSGMIHGPTGTAIASALVMGHGFDSIVNSGEKP